MASNTSYSHFLERAVTQRQRAGEIKTHDEVSACKRSFLLKMAERNETMAEVQMRRNAGNPMGPATLALKGIDGELRVLGDRLDGLGINVRRKK